MRNTPLQLSRVTSVALFLVLAACGGGSSPAPNPTPTPTPTPTPANQAPAITALNISPTSGIAQLTQFSMGGTASDPDGDALTYSWELGDGKVAAGASATTTYTGPGDKVVKLTVTDSRGATTSRSQTLSVGGMAGSWSGTVDVRSCTGRIKPITATLVQNLTLVTGSVTLPEGLCRFGAGSAVTDPAEPGKINAAGAVEIRIKIPPFTDAYLRGNLDASGRRLTGGLYGSGHNGTPVAMERQ